MDPEQGSRRLLRQLLQERGWSCVEVEVVEQQWWHFQESWEVISTWSPRGLRAWLLLERQFDDFWGGETTSLGFAGHRPEAGQPWALVSQINLPFSFDRAVPSGKASWRQWGASLQMLFSQLDAWRNEHAFGAGLAETDQDEPDAGLWREPAKWLAPLRPCLNERKWRLFACACLRRLPEVQQDEESLHVISLAEQDADGLIRKRELRKARKTSRLSWLSSYEAYDEAVAALERAARVLPPDQRPRPGALFNDLEPVRIPLRPSWLRRNGGIVASMAQVIYDRHSFADLPILADALEDAGCSDEIVLAHCRKTPTENHARGCWLLDHLLAKT